MVICGKNTVVRQFGEALHQGEPLVPNGLKSLQVRRVFTTRRHAVRRPEVTKKRSSK